MRNVDIAAAVAPEAKMNEVDMFPGYRPQKSFLHEVFHRRTILIGDQYVVTRVVADWRFKTSD